MSDLNKDGNLFGRIMAALTLAAAVVWVGRICGVDVCPLTDCGLCPFSSPAK